MQHPLRFGSVFSCSLSIGLLCGGALLCARPASTQPQVPGGQAGFGKGGPQAAELKPLIVAFRAEIAQLARTQPEQVASRVDEFLAAHPAIAWSDAALFLSAKAAAQHKQGDAEAALQTYRAALAGFDGEPQKAWAAADLLTGQARVLTAQKDVEGAAQLLGDNWPIIALSNSNRADYAWRSTQEGVKAYVAALDATGHKAGVPDILAGHLLQSPSLLEFAGQANDLGALLLDTISQRLNKAKRGAEVASWARLRYATCRYEVEALDGATLFLGRAWDREKTQQFGRAQREAGAPNPLQDVDPPKLLSTEAGRKFVSERASAMEAELAQTGDAKLVPDLVSLYLASEQLGAAMQWAWRGAQANPSEPESIAQVCRVFKAADLDLVRAQQFVAWSGGKGENPVPVFLAQHADGADVGAATLKARRERKAREQATLAAEWEAVLQAPRGVLLGLVNLGALAPGEARAAGALEVDDTIRLIQEQRVRGWMSIPEREEIRLALGEVLEKQLAALPPKEQPDVPPLVQLALADSKRKRGDMGAVPIYEALIAAAEKRNEKGFDPQSIVPLAHLAMFYSEQGQHLKAAEAWSRWKDVPTSDKWNADWRVMAARSYDMAGEKSKAQQLYAEVPQYEDGWYGGIASMDAARSLIEQNKHKEARALLTDALSAKDSGDVRPLLLSLLGYSYYRTGDWDDARTMQKEASASFYTLRPKAFHKGSGLADVPAESESRLKWIDRWSKEPLFAAPTRLAVSVAAPEPIQAPLTRRFFVRTHHEVPLEVQSNNPLVNAHVSPYGQDRGLFFEQEVIIEISPEAIKAGDKITLLVSSPEFPKFPLSVPVLVSTSPSTAGR